MLRLTPRMHRTARRLWLAFGIVFLAVQLTLPAHQASHPIGQSDLACHYCMLGGHSPAMASTVSLPPVLALREEAPCPVLIRPAAAGLLRQPSSRAPPSVVDA
jgi:hypothetical protein